MPNFLGWHEMRLARRLKIFSTAKTTLQFEKQARRNTLPISQRMGRFLFGIGQYFKYIWKVKKAIKKRLREGGSYISGLRILKSKRSTKKNSGENNIHSALLKKSKTGLEINTLP